MFIYYNLSKYNTLTLHLSCVLAFDYLFLVFLNLLITLLFIAVASYIVTLI